MNEKKYSIVVPIFNEEGAVKQLHTEIVEAMNKLEGDYEIIFINDGSRDKTLDACQGLKPLKLINFRKNFGQTAAMDAGIKAARGELVITMDGDGQNPPADIEKLLNKMKEGDFDVVSGWRFDRKDTFMKNFTSRGANYLRKLLINDGIHDSGCSLKVYKRECFEDVNLTGEMHRFIPAVLKIAGFKIGEEKVSHRARTTGVTKYNFKRVLKGFVDMWSVWFWRKYAGRPLHLFGGLGVLAMLAGGIMGVVIIVLRIMHLISLQNTIWPLFAIFLVLVGIQLFISGLLADMMLKSHYSNGRTIYKIKEVIENKKNEDISS